MFETVEIVTSFFSNKYGIAMCIYIVCKWKVIFWYRVVGERMFFPNVVLTF